MLKFPLEILNLTVQIHKKGKIFQFDLPSLP